LCEERDRASEHPAANKRTARAGRVFASVRGSDHAPALATAIKPAPALCRNAIALAMVKLATAKPGLVWLPRRLANDDERLPQAVVCLHVVAFAGLILYRLLSLAAQSP
jgi:hypothetical protein